MRSFTIAVVILVLVSCSGLGTNIGKCNSIKVKYHYVSFPWPWMCGYMLTCKNAFTEEDRLEMIEQIKDVLVTDSENIFM